MDTKYNEYGLENNIYYDINGNIFIKYKDNYYWLYIDRNNSPNLDMIDDIQVLQQQSNDIKFDKIKYNQNKLKNKILNDSNSGENKISSLESCIDEDNIDDAVIIADEYFPEDKDYYVEKNINPDKTSEFLANLEQDSEQDSEQNLEQEEFKFYRYDNTNYINYLGFAFDTQSVYDTLIINKDSVVMKLESNTDSAYRITINNNKIICNVVGESMRTYRCIFDENKIHIVNV